MSTPTPPAAKPQLRLADGTLTTEYSATPWTTMGETTEKWLVVLYGVGSLFMTSEELAERLV